MNIRSLSFLLAAVAVSATLLLPASRAAALEKETWLGLPVSAKHHEYAWHSGLAMELRQVKVQTTKPIEVDKAWLKPDWADWLTTFSTRNVRVETGVIAARPSSLVRLGVVDGSSSRSVTRLEFSGLKLLFGASELTLPAGEMSFGKDGTLSVIRIVADKLRIEMSPTQDGKLSLLVQTGDIKWPLLPAFLFDDIAAQGSISDDTITLDKIGASGPDGAISAALRVLATDQFQLDGTARMEGVHIEPVVERLYKKGVVTGWLSGEFSFSAMAPTIESLVKSVHVEGKYEVRNGLIDKFGLLEGMRRRESGVVGGGQIRFDRINGTFKGDTGGPAEVTMTGLTSGALHGSSRFSVMPDGKLYGMAMGALLLPSGESVSRSFLLSGNVGAPVLTSR